MAVTAAPSPCLRCVDIDVLCPCESYRQWLVAAYPAEVEPAGCSRCQETEWLGLAGERFDQIAARLGLQARSLERHLERHGRTDLIRTDWKAHV